ncbi:MAG: glycoside hydrolase family 3 protein [Anaerolineae bacterium]|nr:glycoside hydrolase family 3 protein [Anaerolineae bacterium]
MRRVLLALSAAALLCLPMATLHAQDELERQVEAILAQMPLDVRVGQMFMVSFFGEGLNEASRDFMRQMMPGGVGVFASNGVSPAAVTRSTNAWQALATQIGAKVPLLIATDQEGGTVQRLNDGFTAFPWGAALSAMPLEQTSQVAQMTAIELRAVGVNMNFAPVADLYHPEGRFMSKRVWGHDPERVGQAVAAYVRGLQARGVIATLKHFPGHGAAADSHFELPTLALSRQALEREWLPFRMGIAAGAEVVMVAHLNVPSLDPTPNLPATLSKPIVSDVLRGALGFTGVIITDAMDMGAVQQGFMPAEAAVRAVQAGVDMLATGPKLPLSDQLSMKRAIIDAVLSGAIPSAQIDDSVRRILRLKAKYGLLAWQPLDALTASERAQVTAHSAALESIYLRTISVVRPTALLPLDPSRQKIGLIYPGAYSSLPNVCGIYGAPTRRLAYSLTPTDGELAIAREINAQVDVAVIFTFNLDEYPRQASLVNTFAPQKTVVVALQSPYDALQGIQPAGYVTVFNPYPAAMRAACAVLYGAFPPKGTFSLPQF